MADIKTDTLDLSTLGISNNDTLYLGGQPFVAAGGNSDASTNSNNIQQQKRTLTVPEVLGMLESGAYSIALPLGIAGMIPSVGSPALLATSAVAGTVGGALGMARNFAEGNTVGGLTEGVYTALNAFPAYKLLRFGKGAVSSGTKVLESAYERFTDANKAKRIAQASSKKAQEAANKATKFKSMRNYQATRAAEKAKKAKEQAKAAYTEYNKVKANPTTAQHTIATMSTPEKVATVVAGPIVGGGLTYGVPSLIESMEKNYQESGSPFGYVTDGSWGEIIGNLNFGVKNAVEDIKGKNGPEGSARILSTAMPGLTYRNIRKTPKKTPKKKKGGKLNTLKNLRYENYT